MHVYIYPKLNRLITFTYKIAVVIISGLDNSKDRDVKNLI
jgi:hypothetical protein